MKTTFKSFLLEAPTTKQFTLEEAVEFALKHCTKALYSHTLYRGTDYLHFAQYQLVTPFGTAKRRSTTGTNITNTMMSGMSEWSNYPVRNKSLIASSNCKTAGHYSSYVYRVLPVDTAHFGICPHSDLWGSFAGAQKLHNTYVGDNENFDYIIRDTIAAILSYGDQHLNLKGENGIVSFDFSELRSLFNKADEILKPNLNKNTIVDEILVHYEGAVRQSIIAGFLNFVIEKGSVYTAVAAILDPSSNGFKLGGIQDIKEHNVEVWTDSPCLLINLEVYSDFEAKLNI